VNIYKAQVQTWIPPSKYLTNHNLVLSLHLH